MRPIDVQVVTRTEHPAPPLGRLKLPKSRWWADPPSIEPQQIYTLQDADIARAEAQVADWRAQNQRLADLLRSIRAMERHAC